MSKAEKENKIHSFALEFLERQQIVPNLYADQIIRGYKEGYHQAEKDFLDNIWHSPDEEPEIDRKIIWESENFLGKHLDREWKPKIDCFGKKERWCYLADILPSKNWTGERPYSKVDYSKGYDNGYEQAEKDLELTWEDIADILDVTDVIANDDSMEVRLKTMSEEEYCQEVLKRFKEIKKINLTI